MRGNVRVAAYTDYVYRQRENTIFAERAFALFMARVGKEVGRLAILGRLDPKPGSAHYQLPPQVDFVPLPHYPSLSHPFAVARAGFGSLRTFWGVLADVDVVWLLGPHPLGLMFAIVAAGRGRRVVLGVRQDTVEYARARHPHRRAARAALVLLDWCWRLLARRFPVVVVGPQLAERYSGGREVLPITVSLVSNSDLGQIGDLDRRDYSGEIGILTVGRLEREKNPLLLADVLAIGRADRRPWRLVVCGDGPMSDDLEKKLDVLDVSSHAELRGYVPHDAGLQEEYQRAHVFLHVSWTEGLPQVLFEAFAAAVPIVATDVGGVAEAVGDAALLVPPDDPEAICDAISRITDEPELRRELVSRGLELARKNSLDAEAMRVAALLGRQGRG
jgi:glycosyltransferase involved in cell wall biosynthesis